MAARSDRPRSARTAANAVCGRSSAWVIRRTSSPDMNTGPCSAGGPEGPCRHQLPRLQTTTSTVPGQGGRTIVCGGIPPRGARESGLRFYPGAGSMGADQRNPVPGQQQLGAEQRAVGGPQDEDVVFHDGKTKRRAVRNGLPTRLFCCRGDWFRTSDLLNPISEALARKDAKTSCFSAYKSHVFHILQA